MAKKVKIHASRKAHKARTGKETRNKKGVNTLRTPPVLPRISGIKLAVGAAGLKKKKRTDLLLAIFEPGTRVAGIFTKSRTASAPVDWCRKQLNHRSARALVVNSGNANAFTGKAGQDCVDNIARSVAELVSCDPHEVWLASTGVIGEPLPTAKITNSLNKIATKTTTSDWYSAALAIMTTDTRPKMVTKTAEIDGRRIKINGIAKGSGMIAPDMATTLAFVFTDADIPAEVLQELLVEGGDQSFNSITVDSDTSTSDTLLLFATGKVAGNRSNLIVANDKRLDNFRQNLNTLLLELALQVVKDGEGATKLIRIDVTGAETNPAAKRIAFSIANSPRVKTSIAGSDPNWGRIVMAVGKSGELADRDRLKISLGNHLVAENGERASGYNESAAIRAVSGEEVRIAVDVGVGYGSGRVWTCDLTPNYVYINCGHPK